jgi:hypothetical protein
VEVPSVGKGDCRPKRSMGVPRDPSQALLHAAASQHRCGTVVKQYVPIEFGLSLSARACALLDDQDSRTSRLSIGVELEFSEKCRSSGMFVVALPSRRG